MTSLKIILCCLIPFTNVLGQSSDSSVLVKKFELYQLTTKSKIIADSISSVHSNHNIPGKNKFKTDTTLIKSLIDSKSHEYDSAICRLYKIPSVIKPLGWTSDYAHIFSNEQIGTLDSLLSDYEKRTTNEIAIVTFDSSFIHDEDFDTVVLGIHNFWGVGKKIKNNGILIGISTAKRKIRISNGYGIVEKLSDEETKEIIDDIVIPAFKRGDYFEGLINSLTVIMNKVQ